jgi:hypothetical protein
MTAWTETGGGSPVPELFFEEITRGLHEGPEAHAEMTMGLWKLAAILLVRNAKATGESEQEILRQIAMKYTGSDG